MTDDEYRDDFGGELFDALTVRTRDTSPQLTAAAVQRRVRVTRTRRALTAMAVIAVTFAGIGAMVAHQHTTSRLQVAESTNGDRTSALHAKVRDWTWVSDDHGWALVQEPCGSSSCVALYETTDGGSTWNARPTPVALYTPVQGSSTACTRHTCLSGVRFASAKIGWLFGPAFFETDDGGNTWTRVTSEHVIDVEAAHGVAMRLTNPDSECGDGCIAHVDERVLTSPSWHRLRRTPLPTASFLLLQHSDAYTVYITNPAGGGESAFSTSSNRGAAWTAINDPCAIANQPTRSLDATAAPGGVFAVLCVDPANPAAGAIQISTDRGATFSVRRAVPDPPPGVGQIAAATARTVAVAYSDGNEYGVLVTQDGGRTWTRTLTQPRPAGGPDPVLGWQDAHTGRVSFGSDAIWTTTDGGRTWTKQQVAS